MHNSFTDGIGQLQQKYLKSTICIFMAVQLICKTFWIITWSRCKQTHSEWFLFERDLFTMVVNGTRCLSSSKSSSKSPLTERYKMTELCCMMPQTLLWDHFRECLNVTHKHNPTQTLGQFSIPSSCMSLDLARNQTQVHLAEVQVSVVQTLKEIMIKYIK